MKTTINFQVKRMLVVSGLAFFSFVSYVNASGVIKGQVMDENNQPVEYATAVLKDSKTNKFVTGTISNNKGEFVINDVKPGEYKLSTQMIGYEKKDLPKIVVATNKNQVVEKKVVMNETPSKSIVVVAKKKATGIIKGQVMDENNQPVEFATAVLKDSKTDKFVTGAVCNDNGEFIINNVKPGEYKLSTQMIGYEKKDLQKIVVENKKNQVVEKTVIMNETPSKSIVVVAKKTTYGRNNQIAER
ncbi:MAG: carboxypeptidase regulatory-like domain-containing protein [Paludibacter sp.]|nr:carboxypeptidase regulatory-like domain-containing protein [Paludibacter sp.]